MPSLDDLAIGGSGRVARIDLPAADCQRLVEMGLTQGATVKVLRVAPLGDPIEILIRGYHLSLRKSDARSILLEASS